MTISADFYCRIAVVIHTSQVTEKSQKLPVFIFNYVWKTYLEFYVLDTVSLIG